MKRCGKSAPPPRRRGGHGKPRLEQDRIGTARLIGGRVFAPSRPGWLLERPCKRAPRGMAVAQPLRFAQGAWVQNPAYRPSGFFVSFRRMTLTLVKIA